MLRNAIGGVVGVLGSGYFSVTKVYDPTILLLHGGGGWGGAQFPDTYLNELFDPFQLKPSQYMFQMSMNTEQKLANMHTINVPRKTELLDMSEISHQKVSAVSIIKRQLPNPCIDPSLNHECSSCLFTEYMYICTITNI